MIISSLTVSQHWAAPAAGQGFQFCTSEIWLWYYQAGTKSGHFKALGERVAVHVCLCPLRFNAAAVFLFHVICLMAKQKEIHSQALEPFYKVLLGEGKKEKGSWQTWPRLSKVKINTELLWGKGSTYTTSEYFRQTNLVPFCIFYSYWSINLLAFPQFLLSRYYKLGNLQKRVCNLL